MSLNGPVLNTSPLNAGALAPAAAADAANEDQIYRLEVRSLSGTLLNYVRNWHSGFWKQQLGRGSTLAVGIPGEDTNIDNFVIPNQLWLYDNTNTLLEKFHIYRRKLARRGTAIIANIEGRSLINQMNEELVVDYDTGDGVTDSIKNIVRDLLDDHQLHALPIRLGNIDSAIGDEQRHFRFQGMKLRAVLDRIKDTIGGYIEVDPSSRRLNWKRTLGENKGQQIRYRKNEKGIERSEDRTNLVTRVYAYGAGTTPETRIRPPDPFYIDGDTQGTYGIVPGIFQDNTTTSQDELVDAATAYLKDRQYPRLTYAVDMVALEHDQTLGSTFEALEIGSRVTVIDETLVIDIATRIITLDRDLSNPLRVTIQVANPLAGTSAWGTASAAPERARAQTAADVITEIFRRLEAVERPDLGLYDELGIDGPFNLLTLDGDQLGSLDDDQSGAGGLDGDAMTSGSQVATWDVATGRGTLEAMLLDLIDRGLLPINIWVPFTP